MRRSVTYTKISFMEALDGSSENTIYHNALLRSLLSPNVVATMENALNGIKRVGGRKEQLNGNRVHYKLSSLRL